MAKPRCGMQWMQKKEPASTTDLTEKSDVFFIEAGTIHAIGKGLIIAEIQQNSNVTYRVYDYGRVGKDGKKRELHIEKAVAVTNCAPAKKDDSHYPHIADCDYFTVDKLNLDGTTFNKLEGTVSEKSFLSILVLDGEGEITSNGERVSYKKGDSIMKTLDDAIRFVCNSNLDYGTLSQTEEYKMALVNSPMLQSFTDTFKGLQITLTGDLYQMLFSGIDNVKLVILYKVIDTECYYATVEVKDKELKQKLRENAKTMKGVKLTVKCVAGGVDCFELIDIIELDNPCMFGRWICTNCHHDYGFDDPQGYGCDICESKIEQVFDFYKE